MGGRHVRVRMMSVRTRSREGVHAHEGEGSGQHAHMRVLERIISRARSPRYSRGRGWIERITGGTRGGNDGLETRDDGVPAAARELYYSSSSRAASQYLKGVMECIIS